MVDFLFHQSTENNFQFSPKKYHSAAY